MIEWLPFAALMIILVVVLIFQRSIVMANKQETIADRRDILTYIRSLESDVRQLHGRVCTLEEKLRGPK